MREENKRRWQKPRTIKRTRKQWQSGIKNILIDDYFKYKCAKFSNQKT